MKRLCVICARGGSKGVPGKNIRPIAGKPLLAHSLGQARQTGLFDAIAVSSDSNEILGVARQWGADVLVERPAELAGDAAPKIPVIRHAVQEAEKRAGFQAGLVVDVDATSPLRAVEDIRGCVQLLEQSGAGNVITACRARRSPYFNLIELGSDEVPRLSKPLPAGVFRRQDSPACYDMNASIYVWTRESLFRNDTVFNADTRLFVMPEERSIDIDSELDFEVVEFLMARRARA